MSDQQHAERILPPRTIRDQTADAMSRFVPIADDRLARIDPAQAGPAAPAFAPASSPHGPPMREANRSFGSARPDEELLSQASQLVDHLRSQFAELHRRDQLLATQLQQVEHERLALQTWRTEAEQTLRATETELRQREARLADDVAAQQQAAERLRADGAELARQREALDGERIRMLADVANQVAAEKERLQQAIATTVADRQRLQIEFEQRRQLLEQSLRARQEELEAAKARARQEVTEEILTAELRTERHAIAMERISFEGAREAWTGQRDRELAELQQAREIQDAAVAQVRDELIAQRRIQSAELDSARREQEAALRQAQESFAQEREQQLSDLRHERAVLENRLRFQQDHLAKARQEIESAQNEFRRETQRTRAQLQEGESVLRMRQSQLDRVRSLLEERERSVNREREMLFLSQQAFLQVNEHDREQVKRERAEWDSEQSIQLADLRRQQDMLALHAQNLEGRRERLDKLRAELEDTHRTTLEMRMAIEEAWAQMTQACGDAAAKRRLEAAQQQLSAHYRLLRDALADQRRELDESQSQFQQQKQEFRAGQQSLTEWAAEQDRKLRERESSLRHQAEQLNVRESAWRSASQRWINEKIEAESIIRDLLQQLTALTEPASPVSMWPRPQMPVYE